MFPEHFKDIPVSTGGIYKDQTIQISPHLATKYFSYQHMTLGTKPLCTHWLCRHKNSFNSRAIPLHLIRKRVRGL